MASPMTVERTKTVERTNGPHFLGRRSVTDYAQVSEAEDKLLDEHRKYHRSSTAIVKPIEDAMPSPTGHKEQRKQRKKKRGHSKKGTNLKHVSRVLVRERRNAAVDTPDIAKVEQLVEEEKKAAILRSANRSRGDKNHKESRVKHSERTADE
jgi:hypothetical protein